MQTKTREFFKIQVPIKEKKGEWTDFRPELNAGTLEDLLTNFKIYGTKEQILGNKLGEHRIVRVVVKSEEEVLDFYKAAPQQALISIPEEKSYCYKRKCPSCEGDYRGTSFNGYMDGCRDCKEGWVEVMV